MHVTQSQLYWHNVSVVHRPHLVYRFFNSANVVVSVCYHCANHSAQLSKNMLHLQYGRYHVPVNPFDATLVVTIKRSVLLTHQYHHTRDIPSEMPPPARAEQRQRATQLKPEQQRPALPLRRRSATIASAHTKSGSAGSRSAAIRIPPPAHTHIDVREQIAPLTSPPPWDRNATHSPHAKPTLGVSLAIATGDIRSAGPMQQYPFGKPMNIGYASQSIAFLPAWKDYGADVLQRCSLAEEEKVSSETPAHKVPRDRRRWSLTYASITEEDEDVIETDPEENRSPSGLRSEPWTTRSPPLVSSRPMTDAQRWGTAACRHGRSTDCWKCREREQALLGSTLSGSAANGGAPESPRHAECNRRVRFADSLPRYSRSEEQVSEMVQRAG